MYADGKCVPCFAEADCGTDELLETARLHRGFWRLSNRSRELLRCRTVEGTNETPCAGGSVADNEGSGYCVSGTRGPKCEVCEHHDYYFDEDRAKCVECERGSSVALRLLAIIFGISAGVAAALLAWKRRLAQLARRKRGGVVPYEGFDTFTAALETLMQRVVGLLPTAKLCFVFVQTIGLLPAVCACGETRPASRYRVLSTALFQLRRWPPPHLNTPLSAMRCVGAQTR